MYYLYILQSRTCDRHYIGVSVDIENRVAEHNAGEVKSTKGYRPWQVAHVETFSDKTKARKREIFLKKTARARKELFEKIGTPPSSSPV